MIIIMMFLGGLRILFTIFFFFFLLFCFLIIYRPWNYSSEFSTTVERLFTRCYQPAWLLTLINIYPVCFLLHLAHSLLSFLSFLPPELDHLNA